MSTQIRFKIREGALFAAFYWLLSFAGAPLASAQESARPTLQRAPQIFKAKAGVLPPGLTAARVQSHDLAPAHTRGIVMQEIDPALEIKTPLKAKLKAFVKTPRLDVGAFATVLHALFKDNSTGYILQVRKNGAPVYNTIWEWAQTTTDAGKGWNSTTRMHVASVSKFLTAVGMVKALDEAGLSHDTKISAYLPAHWSQGAGIDDITFAHLLQHRSGFDAGNGADKYRTDYAFMKQKVAQGVSGVGTPTGYENMNFGLCRILIAVVNGDVSKNATFAENASDNAKAWDAVTIYHFQKFMQNKIFSPAGVGNAIFTVSAQPHALAYKFPHAGAAGWNSGDLSTVAGAVGWRLSVAELLDVLNHVRRKNTILSAVAAQEMLDSSFGIDQTIDTPAGKAYNKNGAWGSGGKKEQSVIYFLPQGVEVAVFVNSPLGASDFSLRGSVINAYTNCLAD